MLPGFRFLFAAIVLSISILVFGLGAAALLRAAHEEFANTPGRRAAPEPRFAQPIDAPAPVLAMLRVEPAAVEEKVSDPVPTPAAPAEPAAVAQADKIAALSPGDSTPPETPRPEIPASDTAVQGTNLPAPADTPAPADETRIAAVEQVPPPAEAAVAPAPERAPAQAVTETDIAATKIATLGGPPVAIGADTKAASATSDRGVVKKRSQVRRARERRRLALRARLAKQTAARPSPADALSQPTITTRSR